ncbi:hypothetical protein H8356DRAFT_1436015 [Neocallimastix lanati (nom. inval.)]|nr:hypothetical protein H8356DRAFT_1436015 [Neocallimastix sp. JGI-2020a]
MYHLTITHQRTKRLIIKDAEKIDTKLILMICKNNYLSKIIEDDNLSNIDYLRNRTPKLNKKPSNFNNNNFFYFRHNSSIYAELFLLDNLSEYSALIYILGHLNIYITKWKLEIIYPNVNSIVKILYDSTCATLSGPQLGQLYYLEEWGISPGCISSSCILPN